MRLAMGGIGAAVAALRMNPRKVEDSGLQLPVQLILVTGASVHQGQLGQETPAFQPGRQARPGELLPQGFQRPLLALEAAEFRAITQRTPSLAVADDAKQAEGGGVDILRKHDDHSEGMGREGGAI